MKIAQIKLDEGPHQSRSSVAIFEGEQIRLPSPNSSPTSILDLIEKKVDVDQFNRVMSIDEVSFSWLPPITTPNKIFCIGRNYAEHAKETGADIPEIPVVFSKFATALTSHQSKIQLPAISNEVDFEAELVVVIGKWTLYFNRKCDGSRLWLLLRQRHISARLAKRKTGGPMALGKDIRYVRAIGPNDRLQRRDSGRRPTEYRIAIKWKANAKFEYQAPDFSY